MGSDRLKKKILWISHMVPYPPKAGLLIRSYNLIKGISDDFELHLYSLVQPQLVKPYYASVNDGLIESKLELAKYCKSIYIHDEFVEAGFISKVIKASLSLFTRMPYSVNWLTLNSFRKIIDDAISEQKFDLVYIDTIGLIDCVNLTGLSKTPLAMGHHNIESHMMFRRAEKTSNILLKGYFYIEAVKLASLEKKYCSEFDLNVVCSSEDQKRLAALCPSSATSNIPNGFAFSEQYDPIDYIPELNPSSMLFIGTMDWYPNVQAIRFFVNNVWPLLGEYPELVFDVIGANPPEDLREFASRNPRFKIHGFVENIEPYLTAGAIYICPIMDGGGTKLKVIEAMANGLVVIGHPLAFEGLNVSDRVNCIFAESPKDYVDAIAFLHKNSSEGQAIGLKAKEHAFNNFSYQKISEDMVEAFNDCIEGS